MWPLSEGPVEREDGGEVEAVEVLDGGEPGLLDPARRSAVPARCGALTLEALPG
jgi:hypothetical protein